MINVKAFLSRVEEIAAEEPAYQEGHDGRDHLCDCIGLIIGAIRRAGGRWAGTHGSNYAARNEMRGLKKIVGTGDLHPGDIVYKSREPSEPKYKLPDKYKPGGSSYNGDVRDYYHVGVVVSAFPVRIRHMTTPRPLMDTKIGSWAWVGTCKKISTDSGGQEDKQVKVIIAGGNLDRPINLRRAGSSGAEIIAKIPQGTEVELIEAGGAWNYVNWDGKTGYVQSIYVHRTDEVDGEMISISRARLKEAQELSEKLNDILSDILGMRG